MGHSFGVIQVPDYRRMLRLGRPELRRERQHMVYGSLIPRLNIAPRYDWSLGLYSWQDVYNYVRHTLGWPLYPA